MQELKYATTIEAMISEEQNIHFIKDIQTYPCQP